MFGVYTVDPFLVVTLFFGEFILVLIIQIFGGQNIFFRRQIWFVKAVYIFLMFLIKFVFFFLWQFFYFGVFSSLAWIEFLIISLKFECEIWQKTKTCYCRLLLSILWQTKMCLNLLTINCAIYTNITFYFGRICYNNIIL